MARSGRTVARIMGTRRTCRAHHSASPSHVPSSDDPTRRRRPPALRRPDGRRPGRVGPARARAGSRRLRHRAARAEGDRPDRAHPGRQVDRARRRPAPRRRASDVAALAAPAGLVLAAVARRSCTSAPPMPRSAGGSRRSPGPSWATGGRTRAAHWLKTLRSLDGVRVWWAPTDAPRSTRTRCSRRSPRPCPPTDLAGAAGSRGRPAVGEPAAPDRRTQGDRADGLAPGRPRRAGRRPSRRSWSRCPTVTPTGRTASRPRPGRRAATPRTPRATPTPRARPGAAAPLRPGRRPQRRSSPPRRSPPTARRGCGPSSTS